MVDGGAETRRRNTAGLKTTFGMYPAGWRSPSDAERCTAPLGQMVGHCQLQDSLKGCSKVRKPGAAGSWRVSRAWPDTAMPALI